MKKACIAASLGITGGDGRDRTADLLIANQSLSQLSYAPGETKILRGAVCTVNPENAREHRLQQVKSVEL